MNKKGFTLTELLAVIVILSIIMMVAVPSVTSMLDKQERDTYITDAKKLVALAKTKVSDTSTLIPAKNGEITILRFSFLDNGDIGKSPDGWLYSKTDSYVAVVKDDGFMRFYVTLVAEHNPANASTKVRGFSLIDEEDLKKDSARDKVIRDFSIITTSDSIKTQLQNKLGLTNATVLKVYE